MVKAFTLPIEYVLYDMSYANIIMYSACLPSYTSGKDKKGNDDDEVINADDPRNRDKVRQILFG